MAGRIPQSFIDELISRVDIVEIIDERVPLKKAGRDFVACCPFHTEKTPSFSVSPAKQFYYCFGCNAHGTVIGFLMDYAHLDFVDAVQELADRAGVDIPREAAGISDAGESQALYSVLAQASAFYARQLREHPDARLAIEYLKRRGVSGEVAAQFGLGFAPTGWDTLVGEMRAAGIATSTLVGAGLAIEKESGGLYDRFRSRVVFPIRDRRGRTVGFGARALGSDEPKYLNSPETAVFHKGRELYGFHEARQANRSIDSLYVVEGYMDVVALSQAGISNAVATLGTAATADHMLRLFRTTPRISFCFDGDAAGRRAAWRAVGTLMPLFHDGWIASFMFLPEGEDPDSLVRARGAAGFAAEAENALGLSEFLFEQLALQVDLDTLEGCARLVEIARPLISPLKAPALQSLLIDRLGELSGINAAELTRMMREGERATIRPMKKAGTGKRSSPSLIRRAVSLLLHHPDLGSMVEGTSRLRILELPGAVLLAEILDLTRNGPTLSTGAIIEHFRSHEEGKHLSRLAMLDAPVLDRGLEHEFKDALERLDQMVDEQRFDQLKRKAREQTLSTEEQQEFRHLLERPAAG